MLWGFGVLGFNPPQKPKNPRPQDIITANLQSPIANLKNCPRPFPRLAVIIPR